jgi:hypothetical protein
MLNKKSFRSKMKQDFSELLEFLESNSDRTNYSGASDKVLTFGEDIKFTKEKKQGKTFFIPYFEKSSDISPKNLASWDFKIYHNFIFIARTLSVYIVLLFVLFFFFFYS